MSVAGARRRNRPGEGSKLQAEIVEAARRLLESSGTEEAVTLRATAREAGVTAPALYAHFRSRQDIVEAVIAEAFDEFTQFIQVQIDPAEDCVSQLRTGCDAYVEYAHHHTATYHILFTRRHPSPLPRVRAAAATAFQSLVARIVECVRQGRSTSTDPSHDAVLLWLALHGLASLPPHNPHFPWPDQDGLIDGLLLAHAHICPVPGRLLDPVE